MNIKIKESYTNPSQTYPWIGVYRDDEDLMVLFTSPATGICLREKKTNHGVGKYNTIWSELNFKPFYGEITLSNNL